MDIIENPFVLEIYGLGGIAVGKDYVGTACLERCGCKLNQTT